MAGVVLAIKHDGDLLWYRYTGDGTADQRGATGWEPNSSNPIGRGWQNFHQVLGGLQMDAIGGDTPKFLQVAEPEEETFVPTSVRIEVCNPHSVVIGEVVVEVRDGKVHVTPSPADEPEFVFHAGGLD